MIPFAISLLELHQLSPAARQRLHDWWTPDLGDVCVTTDTDDGWPDEPTIYIGGDSEYLPTLEKEHYVHLLPFLTIHHLIAYLHEHGLYQDAKTGKTVLDSLPADDVLDALWFLVREHLENGNDQPQRRLKKGPTVH